MSQNLPIPRGHPVNRGLLNALTFLYQQSCPRRVRDASMMSSATRKNAWNCERLD